MWHAWFSAECDELYGSAVYLSESGPVRVSAVYKDREQGEREFRWEDKRYMGLVGRMIKPAPDPDESFWRMII